MSGLIQPVFLAFITKACMYERLVDKEKKNIRVCLYDSKMCAWYEKMQKAKLEVRNTHRKM